MWRDGARMAEAGALLATAWLLVRFVRLSHWSWLLGRTADRVTAEAATPSHVATQVRTAINRAERRLLGRPLKCLPRAMAMQWMLRRRRVAASLVIGAARGSEGGRQFDLHAWVECGDTVAIGGAADLAGFVPLLVLPAH